MTSVNAVSTVTVLVVCGLISEIGALSISRNHLADSKSNFLKVAASKKTYDDNERAEDQISVRLTTPEHGPLDLNLKKDKDSSHSVPTFVGGKHGKLVRWKEPAGYSLTTYSDSESATSIVVEKRKDSKGSTVRRYRGLLAVGEKFYWIAPVLSRSKSVRDDEDRFQPLEKSARISIGNVEHFLAPAEFSSFKAYDNIISSAKASSAKTKTEKHISSRDRVDYTVELVIANDYSLYKYWYDTYAAYDDPDYKDEETILQLRFYFAGVADQINKRYKSIKQSDFAIFIKLVGFYFAQTVESSQFTEGSDVKLVQDGIGYIQMDKSLGKFGSWVKTAVPTYGKFDHAVLFVGNYLYDKVENGEPSTKSGLAHMEGICDLTGGRCTSINYERGFYSSCQTGAHELGHNLGSNHDAQENECSGADQYVMAAAPGDLNSNNYNNPYTFSPCSIRYFRSFLAKLTSQNKNCLLTLDSLAEVPPSQIKLPGMLINVHQQCYNYQGTNSFYCAGEIHDAELCNKIICWDPDEQTCQWESVEHRAYVGTSCGNKKWCMRGECIYDDNAPEAKDSCLYGDYLGLMYIDEQHPKITCDEMVEQFPEQCYTDDKSKRCCDSCPKIRNPDAVGCEYGDRSPARCKGAQKQHCYDKNFNRDCCAWCKEQEGTDDECIFGDTVDWCSKVEKEPSLCYANYKVCCHSCKAVNTGIEGCEYGDTVPWCHSQELNAQSCNPDSELGKQCCGSCSEKFSADILSVDNLPPVGGSAKCPNGDTGDCSHVKQPHQCYTMDKHCCATCEKLQEQVSGFAGCEYGDRIDNCADAGLDKEYCASEPSINEQCCKTCHSLKRDYKLALIDKLLKKLQ